MLDPLWWYLEQAMLGEVYLPCRQEQLPSQAITRTILFSYYCGIFK